MSFEAKFERVDADDPNRCQYIIPTRGQCILKACEGSSYCAAHGGNRGFQSKEKQSLKNYRLNKFADRISEKSSSSDILSLRNEIGILRLLLEEKINRCADESDLVMMSGPLSDLVIKIEKMVSSCNRLDSKLGNYLDRNEILQFSQVIVKIISDNIEDEALLEKISSEIYNALE